mmetsp:Transcript_67422/g.125921  ORF Transcript_67422/g.125921 Transcript_67422/m.125921 type:complete len:210 (+) Transcript_67422:44-673(+)
MRTPAMASAICIAVPKPRTAARASYEALPAQPPELRRQSWLHHCLGDGGVYVGRPKCDGGWYMVPEVKKGSLFANPFPLKEYPLGESLRRFRAYLMARIDPAVDVATLIETHFPARQKHLLTQRFIDCRADKAASVAHFDLRVMGTAFRAELAKLRGCRLGCWCDPCDSSHCHAGVLADVVNSLDLEDPCAQSHASGTKRKRKRADADL